MKPFVLGCVFARGGSKGVPGKNIKLLAGKPLIAYAIEAGLRVKDIDRLIVSTDDPRIAEVAREYGAEIPFLRPAHLATDDSAEILSWRHAIESMQKILDHKIDVLVSMPATSPLKESQDIDRCLKSLLTSEADCVVTVTNAKRNPYFNMVTMQENGKVQLVNTVSGVMG